CLYSDKAGNVWVGTDEVASSGGVCMYDGNWTCYSVTDGLAGFHVNDIYEDTDGSMWFATWAGISHKVGSTWTTYDTNNYIFYNNVQCILQDLSNNMWFGTAEDYSVLGAGVMKFDGSSWQQYAKKNTGLADDAVYDMSLSKNGNFWFGTGNGVSKLVYGQSIENSEFNDFSVYPNPSNGLVFIQPTSFEKYTISVYDINGKVVYRSEELNDRRILDLSDQISGLYFLKFVSEKRNSSIKIFLN
ncbi:MAG: T9SS type A sorting domain-containing protein, partial [Cytophagia bacterium]|nr:T9SS type A sorting domain-containing protein [Cytophagia bacterium]